VKKRKICVITTSRADYGSLRCLMEEIRNDKALILQVIATGSHLLPEFGLTYKEIEDDGFRIDAKADMVLPSDDPISIVKSVGKGCYLFADVLAHLDPDIVALMGDRFELLSIAVTTLILKIPLCHLSGGEVTEGAIDDSIRHAVTKMATLHFPAAEPYRKRILQMGEDPRYVFNYGHIALDNVRKLRLFTQEELESAIDFKIRRPTAIVTYHPVTLEDNTAEAQITTLLSAIKSSDLQAVFTKSNCDTGGRLINKIINDFCNTDRLKYKFFDSLGQMRYLSCLNSLDLMIGNSSSGLYEAPSFRIPVVNIGDRQKGRLRASNVIDTDYSEDSIKEGIEKALSARFATIAAKTTNPYEKRGVSNVARRIKNKLKTIALNEDMLKKRFFDLHWYE
jgi:UDP-hydrolysing UDP-N-acetyl-D-glucosamine 2-epimerase